MDFTRLDAYLDSLDDRYGLPATDTLIYCKNEIVHRHRTGYSDIAKTKPVSNSDIWGLYSCTKLTTMVASMRLIQEGRLSLDDCLSKYLPAYTHMKVRGEDGALRDAARPIRILDLMTMTAGLDYNTQTEEILRVEEKLGERATTQDIVNAYAASPLGFEPSTRFRYSLCHDVMGAVIEVVSGMTLGEYFKKNIFDPLGMTDTAFFLTKEQKSRLTQQYTRTEGRGYLPKNEYTGGVRGKARYESGGGGLFSTVDDYMKLLRCLADGGTAPNGYCLLTREAIDRMRTDSICEAAKKDFASMHKVGYSYGLGVRTMIDPKLAETGAPFGEFGWDGAACAYFGIDPDNDIAFYFATQMLGWNIGYREVHPAVRNYIYEGLGFFPADK